MKNTFLLVIALLSGVYCMAQESLAFPFQGGKEVMSAFFRDSLTVSPEIMQKKATGTVIFKFSADEKGHITGLVIYYADDAVLVSPVIAALKKSNRKWIIPDREKLHDFIIPFVFSFNPLTEIKPTLREKVYSYAAHRKPIVSKDQIPLNMATLLPTVVISYNAE